MSLFQDQFDALLDHDLGVAPEHRILPTHTSIGAVDLFVSVPAPEPQLFFSGLQSPPLGPTDLALSWSMPTPPSQANETPSPVRDALPLFPPSAPPHAWSLPASTFAQFPAQALYVDPGLFNLSLPQQQEESALGLSLGRPASPPPVFAPQGAFWQPAVSTLPSPGPSHLPAPPPPSAPSIPKTKPRARNPYKRVIDAAELARNLCMPRARKGADGKRTCTVAGCGVRVTAEQLKRHLETHVPQLRHACTYPGCGKRYSRKDALRRHRKTDGHEED